MPSGLVSPACSAITQEFFRSALESNPADTTEPDAGTPPARNDRRPARTSPRTSLATAPRDHQPAARPPRCPQGPPHTEVDHEVARSVLMTRRPRSHIAAAVLARSTGLLGVILCQFAFLGPSGAELSNSNDNSPQQGTGTGSSG